MRTELEQAIADGEFALRYQPIVELSTGATVGVEALVRWHHPRRGLVAPADFIHDRRGDRADRSARHLGSRPRPGRPAPAGAPERAGDGRCTMSVNVSAHQLRAPGFVDRWSRRSPAGTFPTDALVLEITETALLTDDAQVCADLAALRELGVRSPSTTSAPATRRWTTSGGTPSTS